MSTTDNLAIALIETGQSQKEVTANEGFARLDSALTETIGVAMADGTNTITAAQARENAQIVLTSDAETADFDVELPAIKRELIVTNTTAFDATVICAGATTGASEAIVEAGTSAKVYCDGAQVFAVAGGAGAAGVTTFTALLDAPSAYTGKGGQVVRVKANEAGLEFGDGSAGIALNIQTGTSYSIVATDAGLMIALDNIAPITLEVQADATELLPTGTRIGILQLGVGQVTVAPVSGVDVETNSTLKLHSQFAEAWLTKLDADHWILNGQLAGTASVDSFLSLDDVPASYSGGARKFARVKSDETALEFSSGELDINAQTGTSYTLAITDAGKLVTLDNESGITLTVPDEETVPFPVGTQILLAQLDAGQVTIAGDGFVVKSPETLKLRKQYAQAALVKIGSDSWLLEGNLEASA